MLKSSTSALGETVYIRACWGAAMGMELSIALDGGVGKEFARQANFFRTCYCFSGDFSAPTNAAVPYSTYLRPHVLTLTAFDLYPVPCLLLFRSPQVAKLRSST